MPGCVDVEHLRAGPEAQGTFPVAGAAHCLARCDAPGTAGELAQDLDVVLAGQSRRGGYRPAREPSHGARRPWPQRAEGVAQPAGLGRKGTPGEVVAWLES